MSESWDFKAQLEVGSRGEELFLERYPSKIVIYPGREYDFVCTKTQRKIELKTDTYNMDKTDNFFIERFSDYHKQSPGSLWQSKEKGVDIFCYYFVRNNVWFQFNDLAKTIQTVEKYVEDKKLGLVFIKNKGWITAGYKIPRATLESLYEIWEF